MYKNSIYLSDESKRIRLDIMNSHVPQTKPHFLLKKT